MREKVDHSRRLRVLESKVFCVRLLGRLDHLDPLLRADADLSELLGVRRVLNHRALTNAHTTGDFGRLARHSC